jgi:hypothetical protein
VTFGGFGAARHRALEGDLRITHAEGHAVGRGAVFGRERCRLPLGRAVDQQGDVALLQPDHVIGRVHMRLGETHQLQPGHHGRRVGAGELDEIEAVDAERVFLVQPCGGVGLGRIVHGASPESACRRWPPFVGRNLVPTARQAKAAAVHRFARVADQPCGRPTTASTEPVVTG